MNKIGFYLKSGEFICYTFGFINLKNAMEMLRQDKEGYVYLIGNKYPKKEIQARYL